MLRTITPSEMKRVETRVMQETALTGEVLMQNAAAHVARAVRRRAAGRAGQVVCLCGTGNNGGDGLAAMRMLLQSEPGPASDRLTAELFKVEQYVEMLLGYQRLTGPSTDFTLRQCDVNAVMRATARRFAPLFIEKKLRLNYQETTLRALTDEKWLAFVLEQVLSNAVKYTRRGSVTLRADEAAHAVIVEDTGIGIAPEDLPRVFDHGYTGLNGRKDKRATGLGLYLSRRILDQLGHTISIASEPGRGTRVTIGLDSLRMRAE